MENSEDKSRFHFNRSFGMATMRWLLGLIFLLQGFHKVFKWGIDGVYQMAFAPYAETGLPEFLLVMTAWYTSLVELIAGFLLLVGLFRDYSLYFLASVLLIVTFGHGWMEGIWDMQHVIYRAVLLIPLLILPRAWDTWTVDRIVLKKK